MKILHITKQKAPAFYDSVQSGIVSKVLKVLINIYLQHNKMLILVIFPFQ